MSEDEFRLRVGRIRSRGVNGPRTFVGTALAAAARAGGVVRRPGGGGGVFGVGRARALSAQRGLGRSPRRVVVKARVVRQAGRGGALGLHLGYLQREGVTREGQRGELFGVDDAAAGAAFASRCAEDRHHFRFIVAPEDAEQMLDLRAFARDLMAQAERDLGTRLDWVAVDHWNTAQPHLHVLVRGVRDTGEDLVIARDYIAQGLRARACELVTLELGPRSERDIARALDRDVVAERWTNLDRDLVARIDGRGLVDVREDRRARDPRGLARLRRLQTLARLGLAEEAVPGRWRLSADAEPVLRELGARGDIIARIHRALAADGRERDLSSFVLDSRGDGLLGRLAGRGLDDELRGSAYAVVEGLDGRAHHLRLADLADASDAPLGAIVEVRRLEQSGVRSRLVLSVRSDLGLAEQVRAQGATWLDRQLVGRNPAALGEGGGADDVRHALAQRTETLIARGLARRDGSRVLFARDLLQTLRTGELDAAAGRLARETGLPAQPLEPEGRVAGVYRRRLDLASGRFAMIDSGLGFTLVPWRPDLEPHLGRQVDGRAQPGGGIVWSFTLKRGLGR
jgi:type IV secretory pathway VirD2 relaxase